MSEREKKVMLWMTIGVAVIVIILLLLRRANGGNAANGAPVDFAPEYLQYNFPGNSYQIYNGKLPGIGNWTGTATGLPTIPAMSSDSGCGCSSGSSGFFSSTQQMLDQFMTGASEAFNNYEDNVFSSYPDSVTQYFNNPAGAGMSNTARHAFVTDAS